MVALSLAWPCSLELSPAFGAPLGGMVTLSLA
jgi:hypothetical protein